MSIIQCLAPNFRSLKDNLVIPRWHCTQKNYVQLTWAACRVYSIEYEEVILFYLKMLLA